MNPAHDAERPSRSASAVPRPGAVLFDFDGVLADTVNHHVAAWQRTFALLGWAVDEATCLRAMEVDDRTFLREVFTNRQVDGDADVDGWVRRKQDLTLMLLRDVPRVYPGVATLVGRLAGVTRLAVVTTTRRQNVDTVLAAAGLSNAFAVIVSGDDVRATKPDPECYFEALVRLGVESSQAVALEDSPTGLTAARGAGVHAVAIGHRRPHGDWAAPHPYLSDLRDADAVLSLLGFGSGGSTLT